MYQPKKSICYLPSLPCCSFCISIGEGGIEPDPVEARKIFTDLAERGHPFAQVSQENHFKRRFPVISQSFPASRGLFSFAFAGQASMGEETFALG